MAAAAVEAAAVEATAVVAVVAVATMAAATAVAVVAAVVAVAEAGSLGLLNNFETRGRGKLVRVFFYPYVFAPY